MGLSVVYAYWYGVVQIVLYNIWPYDDTYLETFCNLGLRVIGTERVWFMYDDCHDHWPT